MKTLSRAMVVSVLGLVLLLVLVGCVEGENVADDDRLSEVPIPTGAPIDAVLLDDGSLIVLYTNATNDTDESTGLVWFDALQQPQRSLMGHFSFPHTLDVKDGRAVISDSMNGRLVILELNTNEMKVIDFENIPTMLNPNDADFTESGNILFSDLQTGSIIKVTPEGEILWMMQVAGDSSNEIHDPDELPNGNLIFCLSKSSRVVEIDDTGEVVWSYGEDLNWPKTVQRLDSGNTLIGDLDKVIEVTPDGKVVWEHIHPFGGGLNYSRVNGGNTLISTNCVELIAPDGTVIWSLAPQYFNPLTLQETEPNHRLAILRSIGYL